MERRATVIVFCYTINTVLPTDWEYWKLATVNLTNLQRILSRHPVPVKLT